MSQDPAAEDVRRRDNAGSVAMVTGILGLIAGCFPLGVVAIVYGAKGRRLAREGRVVDGSAATAGFWLGIAGTVWGLLCVLAVLFVL